MCPVCVSQVVILQLTQLYVCFEPDNDILGNPTFPLHMVQRLQPTSVPHFIT